MSPASAPYCHQFDLGKRMEPAAIKGQLHSFPLPPSTVHGVPQTPETPTKSIKQFIQGVVDAIESSGPNAIHRVVVPSLLSPVLYEPSSCRPREVLQFLHALRALLRRYSDRLAAILTLPASLYPRFTGLTRWVEGLCDGVIELTALDQPLPKLGAVDSVQGFLRFHSVPNYSGRDDGRQGSHSRESLSFKLDDSSGLVIKSFSLPPISDNADTIMVSSANEINDKVHF
jgi:elongator complex protein 4